MQLNRLVTWTGKKTGLDISYFLSNGVWVALRYGVVAVNGMLVSVLFTRFGSKELLGQYQFVLSVVAMAAFFSLPGINIAILKSMSEGHERSIQKAIRLTFLFGLLAVPLLAGYGLYRLFFLGETTVGTAFILLGCSFPFIYAPRSWYAVYEGKLQFRPVAIRMTVLNIAITGGLLLGLLVGGDVITLVSLYIASNIILSWLFYWQSLRVVDNSSSNELDIKYALAVSFQKFVYGLSGNAPSIAIQFFFGFHAVAIFFIANSFLSFVSGFFSAFSGLYIPLLFRYSRIAYQRIFLQHLLIGSICFLGSIVFLRFFFILLYGDGYYESLRMAYILSIPLLFLPLRLFLVNFFTTRGRNTLVILSYLIANALAICLFIFVKGKGLVFSGSAYVFSLHVFLILPLLVAYFRLSGGRCFRFGRRYVADETVPDRT